jgi:hypothetical protein
MLTPESVVIALFLGVLALLPIAHYYYVGWPWKRNDIVAGLSSGSKAAYLVLFQNEKPDQTTGQVTDAVSKFEKFYRKWFSRDHLIAPTVLLLFVILLLGYFVGEAVISTIHPDEKYIVMPVVALAGFMGAYTFVVAELISRGERRDLSPSDILRATLRLGVGIAIGYAAGALAIPELGAFIAFAIGAFPLRMVEQYFKRAASKQMGGEISQAAAQDPVIMLAGVDQAISERLEESDITTITQLAYSDPIQLAMQTNLRFNFIVDIVSQDLAWVYLEDKLKDLRQSGLRGAFEIFSYYIEKLEGKTEDEQIALIKSMADCVKISNVLLFSAFYQIAGDPYAIFLNQVYADVATVSVPSPRICMNAMG